jgi:flagellar biosynthesis/type III secretory pathway protein FliH
MAAVDEAFERWAYDQGWSAGRLAGHGRGFAEGYAAGFDAGAELAAARLLAAVEPALRALMVRLVPELGTVMVPGTVQKGRCG